VQGSARKVAHVTGVEEAARVGAEGACAGSQTIENMEAARLSTSPQGEADRATGSAMNASTVEVEDTSMDVARTSGCGDAKTEW